MSHAIFLWWNQKYLTMENSLTQLQEPTDEMKQFMQLHNLNEFSEVLKIKPEKLLEMEGFGWRLMKEYVKATKRLI